MTQTTPQTTDVLVIGAGLTGLTTAYYLQKDQKNFIVLEKQSRVGGVIHSTREKGFLFENGPNTGVVGNTTVIPSDFGTLYESAIVSGTTSEVDGNEKRDALIKIIEKYSTDFIIGGNEYIDKLYDRVCVIKLSIQSITGKAKRQ